MQSLSLKDCLPEQSQRHQVLLGDGQRAGFFLGDAAGVGKGRQVSIYQIKFIEFFASSFCFSIFCLLIYCSVNYNILRIDQ